MPGATRPADVLAQWYGTDEGWQEAKRPGSPFGCRLAGRCPETAIGLVVETQLSGAPPLPVKIAAGPGGVAVAREF